MSERAEIHKQIEAYNELIKELKAANEILQQRDILLCDEVQWFTEENEVHLIKRRPRIEKTFLIGRVHWKEDFKDMDSDAVITIERTRIVRVNGEWGEFFI